MLALDGGDAAGVKDVVPERPFAEGRRAREWRIKNPVRLEVVERPQPVGHDPRVRKNLSALAQVETVRIAHHVAVLEACMVVWHSAPGRTPEVVSLTVMMDEP